MPKTSVRIGDVAWVPTHADNAYSGGRSQIFIPNQLALVNLLSYPRLASTAARNPSCDGMMLQYNRQKAESRYETRRRHSSEIPHLDRSRVLVATTMILLATNGRSPYFDAIDSSRLGRPSSSPDIRDVARRHHRRSARVSRQRRLRRARSTSSSRLCCIRVDDDRTLRGIAVTLMSANGGDEVPAAGRTREMISCPSPGEVRRADPEGPASRRGIFAAPQSVSRVRSSSPSIANMCRATTCGTSTGRCSARATGSTSSSMKKRPTSPAIFCSTPASRCGTKSGTRRLEAGIRPHRPPRRLSYLVLQQQDAVGLATFDKECQPLSGR